MALNQWQFMAALVLKNQTIPQKAICGATLIKQNWLLTAAHCIQQQDINDLDIFIGNQNLNSRFNERIAIKRSIIHPDFDPDTFEADLALLELHKPVAFQPLQLLARFSQQDQIHGHPVTVLGWGEKENGLPSNELLQIQLPIIRNSECNLSVGGVTENMICLGDNNAIKDSCAGDSGGPAFFSTPETSKLSQIGIISFGFGCARKGFPGIYTRVANYTDFISDSICSAEEVPDAPQLQLHRDDNTVTANWSRSNMASGYIVNYAPFPAQAPISSIDVQQANHFTAILQKGAAYYVAITAYRNNCRSAYSNIQSFSIN